MLIVNTVLPRQRVNRSCTTPIRPVVNFGNTKILTSTCDKFIKSDNTFGLITSTLGKLSKICPDRLDLKEKVNSENVETINALIATEKFTAKSLPEAIEYINGSDLSKDEMIEKINLVASFPELLKATYMTKGENDKDKKYSTVYDFLDYLPEDKKSDFYMDLLTSPVLDNKFQKKMIPLGGPDSSLSTIMNYMIHEEKKISETYANYEKEYQITNFKKKVAKDFPNILLVASVFDGNIFNEIVHNRSDRFKDYVGRLKKLPFEDMIALRNLDKYAVEDTEDNNDNQVTSQISLNERIGCLNLLSLNNDLKKAGFPGVDFNDYTSIYDEDRLQFIQSRDVLSENNTSNFYINLNQIKKDLMPQVLENIGVPKHIVDDYKKDIENGNYNREKHWDIHYVHLLNAPENSLLRDVIVEATKGTYQNFITNDKNEIGVSNAETKGKFEKYGLNYNEWLRPTINLVETEFTHKNNPLKKKSLTPNMWNRIPQESLFDGNYTTCCTGIDKEHGPSFVRFLTETAFNTIEVRSEKGKVIGMSRLFMAVDAEEHPFMVVENIEVNNRFIKNYLYNDKEKVKYREMIFDYARDLAKLINEVPGREIPVYFSANHYKVKGIKQGLKPSDIKHCPTLLGPKPNNLYINAFGGEYDVFTETPFNLNLHDITIKSEEKVSNN